MATPEQDRFELAKKGIYTERNIASTTKGFAKFQIQGIFVDITENQVGDRAAVTGLREKQFADLLINYALSFAVVKRRDGRTDAPFVTTAPHGSTPGVHAEKKMLDKYIANGNIQGVESISMNFSPCSSCTVCLILAFWFQRNKPTIIYLYHDESNRHIHKHVEKNIELLEHHGFKIEKWCPKEMIRNMTKETITVLEQLLVEKETDISIDEHEVEQGVSNSNHIHNYKWT